MKDINDLKRKLATATDERRSLYVETAAFSKKASDEKRSFTGEEETQYQKMNDALEPLDSLIRSTQDEIRSLDEQGKEDQKTAEEIQRGSISASPLDGDQYRSAFDGFIRTGDASELRELKRSMSGITTTGGEEFVPTEFFTQVEKRIAEENSLSGLIETRTIGSRHATFAIHTGVSVAVPRSEGEAYNVNDGTLGQKTVNVYNFGHITKVSEELLADSFTDVAGFVAQDQAQAYANAIEVYGLQGKDGAPNVGLTVASVDGKVPEGILNDAGIAAIESLVSGSIGLDDLINITEDVPSSVENRASILTHKSVSKALRIMKDADGRPLWQPNIQAGRPALFNGHEVFKSDFMPALAAGATPLLFGDFSKITMYLRQQMTMMRLNERYRDSGEIGFRGSLRMDIVTRQPGALRKLTIQA